MRRWENWCLAKAWGPFRSQCGHRSCSPHRCNRQDSTCPSTDGLLDNFVAVSLFCDLKFPHTVCSPSHSSLLSLRISFFWPPSWHVIMFSLMYQQQGRCFALSLVLYSPSGPWEILEIHVFYVTFRQDQVLHFPPCLQVFLSKL